MKLSKKHYLNFSKSYIRKGRKKGYVVRIVYNSMCNLFYFILEKEEWFLHSLLEKMGFKTEEECTEAAEKYIDNLIKKAAAEKAAAKGDQTKAP